MDFPAGLDLITVIGGVTGFPDATPRVKFRCPIWLTNAADNTIIAPFEIPAVPDADGNFTVLLPATDDPGIVESGWQYEVELRWVDTTVTGALSVLRAGGSIALASAIEMHQAPAEGGPSYLATATRGAPGGVAGLDVDGDVVNAAGAKITGGGGGGSVAWTSITGKPSTFAPSAHSHVISDVTGLSTALGLKADASALAAKADLASPALTGTPTAPTPASNDNSTKLATTAFVKAFSAPVLVLAAAAAVPGGTPAGTVIVRLP